MAWQWEVAERDHEIHVAFRRALFGWAIFVGRKP